MSLEEVMAWEWVAENTPELEGDSTARKELAGRLLDAQSRLNALCDQAFDRVSGAVSSVWVQGGQILPLARPLDITAALSDACDSAFPSAPIVRNELVNRRLLSSSAAAARRTLVERMLSAPLEPRLGISGFPPELSMYRSVLEDSGLHHPSNSGWQFGPSDSADPRHVAPLWQGMDAFLSSTEREKRSVADLFAMLQAPPYGIRQGLLPIYLAAAILGWEQEVALYETGTFLPKVDVASFERLMKSPEQFSIQRYRLGEARSYLFREYSSLLAQAGASVDSATLLTSVRPLFAFARQLPPYTRLTQSLSPQAIAVREAILSARDPHRLIFVDLPQALGMPTVHSETDVSSARDFFAQLRRALLELQHAYGRLLDAIQQQCASLHTTVSLVLARLFCSRPAATQRSTCTYPPSRKGSQVYLPPLLTRSVSR